MTATFPPTAEQQQALALFQTGQSLAIEAGAGTGKTSTLVLLAEAAQALGRHGQYVAFNKAIVSDASQQMPGNVRCSTAHSLAFKAVGINYRKRLDSSARIKSWELAKILRVQGMQVDTFLGDKKWVAPTFLAGLVMRSIEIFCQSADPAPTRRHVPRIEGLDHPGNATTRRGYEANNAVGAALEPVLRRAWDDLSRYEGVLPFRHSHYLKVWQLSKPTLKADFILFDEAQDASPVMLDVIQNQSHAQVVYVGDSQQAIYEFTGAVNALQSIASDAVAYLTRSFRFGPAVAEVANDVLGTLDTRLRSSGKPGAALRLTGADSIASVIGPVDEPDCILTRTNATAVRAVLTHLAKGKRVALVGGGSEITSFARAAQRLMDGERVEHPELACFSDWSEVQQYVDEDEQGADLRLMVTLIDEFGVAVILEALDQTRPETACDVVVSTAHKAKGREWGLVQLGSDFPNVAKINEAELRLLYVACTRARHELDVTAVPYFMEAVVSPQDALEAREAVNHIGTDAAMLCGPPSASRWKQAMDDPRYPDVDVELTGTDGNAFAVMGAVVKELRRAAVPKDEIEVFCAECTSGDYDHLLQTCIRWVSVS